MKPSPGPRPARSARTVVFADRIYQPDDEVPQPADGAFIARLDPSPAALYLADLSPSSRPTQRAALERMAALLSEGAHTAATLPWHHLTYAACQALRAHLNAEYSPATVNRHLAALRGTLHQALRLGLMSADDHARTATINNVKGTREPAGRALTDGEVAALLRTCRDDPRPHGRRDGALIASMFNTGMRRAEIAGIDLADLLDDATVRVRGKGNRERLVYLNDEVVELVNDWLETRGEHHGALFNAISTTGTIRTTGRLTPSTIRDILVRRAKAAGVTATSPHDLRRTFASRALEEVDLLVVARMGGWRSLAVLERYDRRDARQERLAAAHLRLPA